MKVEFYRSADDFGADTLDILLENEVQNNLPIGFIMNSNANDTSKWIMATVMDDAGSIILTAACTPPFNIVMYETRNKPNDAAVRTLALELKSQGIVLPGVLAERGLAARFADCYAGAGKHQKQMSMNIMQLDRVNEIPKAPGKIRVLTENDLFFVPFWERAFSEECNVETYTIVENTERVRRRLGRDIHYIWEDGIPVSQAVHGRSTVNGAVVNGVYTPPGYRGRGYASSTVAQLSQILLERGNKFCSLFADADNPISCGIYRKIGYIDKCVFDEVHFTDCIQTTKEN